MGILDGVSANNLFVSASQQQAQLESLSNQALSRGIDLYTNQDYAGAVKEFQRAINLDSSSPYAANATQYLAQSYLKLDQTEKAIKTYQTALKRNPADGDMQLALGNLFYGKERYPEAVDAYRKAAERDPGSSTAHYSLGEGLMQLGRYDEAARSYSRVIRLEPNSPHGYLGLGKVYARQGSGRAAIAQFDTALSKQRDYYEAVAEKGYVYADLGQIDKARELADFLDGKDKTLHALLKGHIDEVEPPRMSLAWSTGTFRFSRTYKTPLASLDSYFATANASKTMTMKILFSKDMDRRSIENIANWSIDRASNVNLAKTYNFGQPIPETEVAINPLPNFVLYDAATRTATIGFTLTQNSTATGTIDPSHMVFKFSGKDAEGIRMDSQADEFSGFSRVA